MSKYLLIPIVTAIVLISGWILLQPKNSPEFDSSATINIPSSPTPMPTSIPNDTIQELIIEDLQVGTGSAVKSGDTVTIHYVGTLADGAQFDSSYTRGQPFQTQIGIGRVIQGWDQGLIGMKAGGKRRLSIPPHLGYGQNGVPGAIPPNATLIFDLELISVQ